MGYAITDPEMDADIGRDRTRMRLRAESVQNILLATTDAVVWAHHFVEQFGDSEGTGGIGVCPDEATMITWFANALETGRNQGRKELCPHRYTKLSDVLWACTTCGTVTETDPAAGGDYRIALRPYTSEGGKGESPDEWDDLLSPPLDDIVVRDVAMFRMEDMGDHFWMACYLDHGPDPDTLTFTVRRGRSKQGEPPIVVEAYEFPDVVYETSGGAE